MRDRAEVDAGRRRIYISTSNGYTYPAANTTNSVMALDLDSGKRLWTRQLTPNDAFLMGCGPKSTSETCPQEVGPDFAVGTSPILQTLPDGRRILVVGQKSGLAWGLNPDDGTVLWQHRVGQGSPLGGIEWGGAADGQHVYYPNADGLLGNKAFDQLVIPAQLVRRIVATVYNLPRQTAPRRAIPLEPVPGSFSPEAGNDARYAPYVRVLESIDTRAMVARYIRTYPLFQRAYEELGFPGRYFNDRLVEALDDLIAAPELASPPGLVQAKVLYEFADPALEGRSAGQKIMMRMGPENAARVKAKLREIRRELAALRKPS